MKTKQIKIFKLSALFLFILIATQSCMVSSLHPLYTNMDRVHLDELNAKWIDSDSTIYSITTKIDSSRTIPIQKKLEKNIEINTSKHETEEMKQKVIANRKSFIESIDNMSSFKFYEIIITEKTGTTIFLGKLSKLDKYYFLDVIPDEDHMEKKLDDNYMISLVVPMHGFFRLELMDEKLKLNWIFSEDLKKLRKNKKIRLEHISRDDREIITAKTTDIQKFLIKFADSKLFNNHKDAELILTPLK